jgi:hypothetical protein
MDIDARFESVNDDYLKFDLVENKRSQRPDLNAFILLDEISPSPRQGHGVLSKP